MTLTAASYALLGELSNETKVVQRKVSRALPAIEAAVRDDVVTRIVAAVRGLPDDAALLDRGLQGVRESAVLAVIREELA